MTKKELKLNLSFSSIFNQFKWLNSIEISGFSCRRGDENYKLYLKIYKLVKKFNKEK